MASVHLYNYIDGTGKVLSSIVVENKYTRCDGAERLKNDTEVHDCLYNY